MSDNKIFETQDGSHSLFSEKYQVSYHSKYGAIQETEHVFIKAGLYEKSLVQKEIDLLEIGFGTGLNAFMTFLEAQKRKLNIRYTAFEAYPITMEMAQQLNFAAQLKEPDAQALFMSMHSCEWGTAQELSPHFTFQKEQQSFEQIESKAAFDLIYFDAFAPNAQPELWEEPLLRKMYEALRPGGVWVTYCAKGAVKRGLKALGFRVETLPGPPGKREMIRAVKE
jgi:tRNA U34 5-methylaminomethyl-2-thiouridine-forming methyltransferase MnmC